MTSRGTEKLLLSVPTLKHRTNDEGPMNPIWDGRPDIVTNVTPCHAMSRFEYTNPGEGNECAGSGCIRRHGMTQS